MLFRDSFVLTDEQVSLTEPSELFFRSLLVFWEGTLKNGYNWLLSERVPRIFSIALSYFSFERMKTCKVVRDCTIWLPILWRSLQVNLSILEFTSNLYSSIWVDSSLTFAYKSFIFRTNRVWFPWSAFPFWVLSLLVAMRDWINWSFCSSYWVCFSIALSKCMITELCLKICSSSTGNSIAE